MIDSRLETCVKRCYIHTVASPIAWAALTDRQTDTQTDRRTMTVNTRADKKSLTESDVRADLASASYMPALFPVVLMVSSVELKPNEQQAM